MKNLNHTNLTLLSNI